MHSLDPLIVMDGEHTQKGGCRHVVVDVLYEYVYYACAGRGGLLLELLEFVDSCVSRPEIKPNRSATMHTHFAQISLSGLLENS